MIRLVDLLKEVKIKYKSISGTMAGKSLNFNKYFEYIQLDQKIFEISVINKLMGTEYMDFEKGSMVTNNRTGVFIMPKSKNLRYRGLEFGVPIVPDERSLMKIENALKVIEE